MTGHRPPERRHLPTRLDGAKREYIEGRSSLAELEQQIDALLADGTADLAGPPPPKIAVPPARRS